MLILLEEVAVMLRIGIALAGVALSGALYQGLSITNGTGDLPNKRPCVGSVFDLRNPHMGSYEPVDYWLQRNAVDAFDLRRGADQDRLNSYRSVYSEQAYCITTLVVDGYPLPYRQYLKGYFKAMQEHRLTEYLCSAPLICTAGPVSKKQVDEFDRLRWELKARYFPPVPKWLLAAPPIKARLLPDGRVLVLGELGAAAGRGRGELIALLEQSQQEALYSADGKLLAQGKTELWLPVCDKLSDAGLRAKGELKLTADKYLELREHGSGRLLNLWDVDGQPIALDSLRESRSVGLSWIWGDQLPRLREAQQKLGFTGRTRLSNSELGGPAS
jgi:hypothetical protein